jgi:hypothetical protein
MSLPSGAEVFHLYSPLRGRAFTAPSAILARQWCAIGGMLPTAASATAASTTVAPAGHQADCALGPDHSIRHVIYIQFDNVHFRRVGDRVLAKARALG